jgi:Ca2+-binding EF-hand superfamily protein
VWLGKNSNNEFEINAKFSLNCRELGDKVNEEELKAMIDEFDLDGDGESKRSSLSLPQNFLSDIFSS